MRRYYVFQISVDVDFGNMAKRFSNMYASFEMDFAVLIDCDYSTVVLLVEI